MLKKIRNSNVRILTWLTHQIKGRAVQCKISKLLARVHLGQSSLNNLKQDWLKELTAGVTRSELGDCSLEVLIGMTTQRQYKENCRTYQ